MNRRPALTDLIVLARAAGAEIMRVRAAGFEAQEKLDGSIVTLADQRAEALIEDGLARLAPGVPMIGEEAVAAGRIPKCDDLFFCVDPLDGTKGFAKGGDEFTVNIGLIADGEAIMGVVFAPATGELYAGEPGHALGARYDVQTAQEISALAPIAATAQKPTNGWRVVASENSGRTPETADFIAAIGGAALTHASSSIKFCRVAEGKADLYPRLGDVSEWDAAAAHAVLNAAGGGVMHLDGVRLRYGVKPDAFIIHGFVAYANEEAESAALRALNR
jgi:3'(2'),5'-bisphosphate nucleotidase